MLFCPQTSNPFASTIVFVSFPDVHFKQLNISFCQQLTLFMIPLILPIMEHNNSIFKYGKV